MAKWKSKGSAPKPTVRRLQARTQKPGLSGRTLLAAFALGGVFVGTVAFALAKDDNGGYRGESAAAGPVHVHGLGINPADRALLIATHTGTYRVAPSARKAERIGNSRQDTMGFSVAGPNYFLGSGHPDVREAVEKNLPPLLGLIESRDAGKTWQSISLSGEADFHVLRLSGRRVYGYDASHDRLLTSPDSGRTWAEATLPTPLLDLAVDPTNADGVVVSGEGGLYNTRDGGQTWARLAPGVGLLAWPTPRRLYLLDLEGAVLRSANAGERWMEVGNIGGEPAAFVAQSNDELYAALHDGSIKHSKNGGRSWSLRSTP